MTKPRYSPGQTIKFEVKRNRGVRTLTSYLASRIYVHERRALILLQKNAVKVDGKIIAPEEVLDLKRGSIIEVTFPSDWPQHLKATEMPLDIIYEDESIVILNKPPGIVVHPARGHMSGETMQNGLIHRYQDHTDSESTIAPAHRIDRNTSGIILFSRTREAYRCLTAQFARGTIRKTYLAICEGKPDWQEITVNKPLGDDPLNFEKTAILPISEGGKEAITEFKLLESGDNWSLIQAHPITGRTHQIRVHLASLGMPIFADSYYHPNHKMHNLSRHALHAWKLTLTHPTSNKTMKIEATLHKDMETFLDSLRSKD